jgi:tetratricopeptide (TPR) repeat protein
VTFYMAKIRPVLNVVLPALAVVGIGVLGYMAFAPPAEPEPSSVPSTPTASANASTARRAQTLDDLLAMSPAELARVDIAEMNLLCATGLPGAEEIDIDRALAQLDAWAQHVRHETDRHLYRFRQDPSHYENSEGYFRMLMLVNVLQQDCGVHYNMTRVREVDFRRSQDLFIHGMTGSNNGGTCVSMPVIYTAVARRLGYPVRLVLTHGHVFCRWDAPDERFNIEATNRGMNTFPDEHYLTWPTEITAEQAEAGRYLISLSPAEELACFLASRGHCLLDNGRVEEALAAYSTARKFAPLDPAYGQWVQVPQRRLDPLAALNGLAPQTYRDDDFRRIQAINAHNRRLLEDDRNWQPPDE